MNSGKKYSLFICAVLALVTLAVYWPVWQFDFVNYDDPDYVSKNPFVHAGLTWDGLVWALHTGHASNWHPLTWISHMLDWQIYGDQAGGHHLTNLLLHIANSLLLFLVLKKMTGAIWRSAFVSALFAWHPLHVESVAWIAERKDVLSTFFWMLTIWAYARYVEAHSLKFKVQSPQSEKEHSTFNIQHPTFKAGDVRRSMFNVECSMFYSLALIFFALGLMSKPMVVTLPFVLLLLDFWPLNRMSKEVQSPKSKVEDQSRSAFGKLWSLDFRLWTSLLLEKIPFFALAAISSAITFFVQRHAGTVRTLTSIPFEFRLVNVFLSYFRYLGKMIWPDPLAVFYPLPDFLSLWVGLIASVALLALTIWIFVSSARRKPYLIVGWLWFLGTLVPVIGFVQVGAQSMADRYSYIPLIGIFILLTWWIAELTARFSQQKFLCSVAAVAALSACLVRTAVQLPNWRNSFTLFEHALAVTGNNFVANVNLGSALLDQGKLDAALEQYTISLQTDPTFEAHGSMAMIYEKQGKLELATEQYRAALALNNDRLTHNNFGAVLLRMGKPAEAAAEFSAALKFDPQYPEALCNLGLALAQQGKVEEAINHCLSILKTHPRSVEAHDVLGQALEKQQNFSGAVDQYRIALGIDGKNVGVRMNLANLLLKMGRADDAIAEFSEVLRIKPDYAEGHYNLGVIFGGQKKMDAATREYLAAIKLKPDYADAHNNLAIALVDEKKFAEAAVHLGKVVALRPDDAEAHFNLSYVLSKLGKSDEAKIHYELAMRLNPDLLKNRKSQ